MIAKLRGVLDSVGDGWAVVDVGGVGYLTYCSSGTLASMPAQGQAVSLTIETVVREDHIHLYGFASEQERDWFRLLQTVQSVGARLALAILGRAPRGGARRLHRRAGQGGAHARTRRRAPSSRRAS